MTAPEEHIPELTLNARDICFPEMLEFYAERCERKGADAGWIEYVRELRLAAIEWQRHHKASVVAYSVDG